MVPVYGETFIDAVIDVTLLKLGHCCFQIRPLGVKTGQYPRRPWERIVTLDHFRNMAVRWSEVGSGSNWEELSASICFPLCPRTRTLLDTFGTSQKSQQSTSWTRRPRVQKNPSRRYRVFFEVRADLAWVARSISGGGCCSPAIAHQTLT